MKKNVVGFLRREGEQVVNDDGPVFLEGWNIGNWLVPEGYMWESGGATNFDRPRRINARFEELLGHDEAQSFWLKFRDAYITQADIDYIKAQGYNSIRLPFDSGLLLKDEPGLQLNESGFDYIQRVIDWCHQADMYVIIDMHAAPGGQTGSNMDNSVDNFPRLYTDKVSYDKGIGLWREIARRYANDPYVGGYDLLNEPVRTQKEWANIDYLLPRLAAFYTDAIAAIREVDTKHMLSLEGHHWANDPNVFTHRYDENMVVHFHYYGGLPEASQLQDWFEVRQRLNVPLWMGESGENEPEWTAAMGQICRANNIGYCFWPYKKMGVANGCVTVKIPEGWADVINYVNGAPHPGYEQMQMTFNQLIENCRFENCQKNDRVDREIRGISPYDLRATDFLDDGCIGHNAPKNLDRYRFVTPMEVIPLKPKQANQFDFDTQWNRFVVRLSEGEQVQYLIRAHQAAWTVKLQCRGTFPARLVLEVEGNSQTISVNAAMTEVTMPPVEKPGRLTLRVAEGQLSIETIEL
ncbi:glycoside hydrolase family 5 protein [Lacticaseibacillus hegangensis]|uniref:Glycoside hydrolase family 5 protein n=1 Tax=Lacticaseibacillus hegangensis TaxID=2486010 RepID=A0ABW4CU24_9LACO|nr:glycoside hydrolase family 5 protein [Lacticaseibacillus hegangensis]